MITIMNRMLNNNKKKYMKKLFSLVMLCIALTINAQTKVTEFLGIPVDGTKAEMIEKIKDKGFVLNKQYDWLEGEFNGKEVSISVVTTKNKVNRIFIIVQPALNSHDIKNEFNGLFESFSSHPNYISRSDNRKISSDEDIEYCMIIKNKRYQATFYQKPIDDNYKDRAVWFTIVQSDLNNDYFLLIYYDNLKNFSNGEDL